MDGKIADDSQGEGANERLCALNFTVGKISAVSEFRTQISRSAGQCLTDPQGLLNCLEKHTYCPFDKFEKGHGVKVYIVLSAGLYESTKSYGCLSDVGISCAVCVTLPRLSSKLFIM